MQARPDAGPKNAVPSHPNRLQLATRMHELLLREIGHGIEIERLLTRDRYARDVLLVCEACVGTDLPLLATEFRRLTPIAPRMPSAPLAHPGHAQQATDWSHDTSGFGVSRPPEGRVPPAPEAPPGWRGRLPWR